MKDCLERDIKVGDYIVYPGHMGRSVQMRIAKVVDVSKWLKVAAVQIAWNREYRPMTKLALISYSENCTIMPVRTIPKEARDMIKDMIKRLT